MNISFENQTLNGLFIPYLQISDNKLVTITGSCTSKKTDNQNIETIRELFLAKKEISEIYMTVPVHNTVAKQSKIIVTVQDKQELDYFQNSLLTEKSYVNPLDFIFYTEDMYHEIKSNNFKNLISNNYYNLPSSCIESLKTWLRESHSTIDINQALPISDDDNIKKFIYPKSYESLKTGKRRLRGAPGTGKTTILARLAINSLNEDRNVLITCFNKTMVNYIHSLIYQFIPQSKGKLTITNFHNFVRREFILRGMYKDYINIFKNNFGKDSDQKIVEIINKWDCSNSISNYDTLLIDEGQDFDGEWWNTLRRFAKNEAKTEKYNQSAPKSHFLVCYDYGQNIYDRPLWLEEKPKSYGFEGRTAEIQIDDEHGVAKTSFRVPYKIIQLATLFAKNCIQNTKDFDLPIATDTNDNSKIYFYDVQNLSEGVELIQDFMRDELSTPETPTRTSIVVDNKVDGLKLYNELKIITPKKINHLYHDGANDNLAKIGFSPTSRDPKTFKFVETNKILMSTFHSFKGWESESLVLVVRTIKNKKDLALFYTMLTRVKKSLNNYQPSRLLIINQDRFNPFIGSQSEFRKNIKSLLDNFAN
jgi:hypothetical protein